MTMTAMQILDAPFAMEARVHMDRYDLPPEVFQQVRASIAHKAYLEEIKPFVKQIVAVKSLAMPSYVQHKDGCIERAGDGLTESMREIVNRHQGWIDEITARYNKMTAQATSAKPPAAPAPCPGLLGDAFHLLEGPRTRDAQHASQDHPQSICVEHGRVR
jgi:hypothetical protein